MGLTCLSKLRKLFTTTLACMQLVKYRPSCCILISHPLLRTVRPFLSADLDYPQFLRPKLSMFNFFEIHSNLYYSCIYYLQFLALNFTPPKYPWFLALNFTPPKYPWFLALNFTPPKYPWFLALLALNLPLPSIRGFLLLPSIRGF